MGYSRKNLHVVGEATSSNGLWKTFVFVLVGLVVCYVGWLIVDASTVYAYLQMRKGAYFEAFLRESPSVLQWLAGLVGAVIDAGGIVCAYLNVRKGLASLRPAKRMRPFASKVLAIVLCAIIFVIWTATLSLVKGRGFGGRTIVSYWDYLILIAFWHAIWRAFWQRKEDAEGQRPESSWRRIVCEFLAKISKRTIVAICAVSFLVAGVVFWYALKPEAFALDKLPEMADCEEEETCIPLSDSTIDSFLGMPLGMTCDIRNYKKVGEDDGEMYLFVPRRKFLSFDTYTINFTKISHKVECVACHRFGLLRDDAKSLCRRATSILEEKYGTKMVDVRRVTKEFDAIAIKMFAGRQLRDDEEMSAMILGSSKNSDAIGPFLLVVRTSFADAWNVSVMIRDMRASLLDSDEEKRSAMDAL